MTILRTATHRRRRRPHPGEHPFAAHLRRPPPPRPATPPALDAGGRRRCPPLHRPRRPAAARTTRLDDASCTAGRRRCPAEGDPDRLRALGVRAGDAVSADRPTPAGLRLRRLRPERTTG